ncbi:MAG: D-alanyl-D-alanine carboxypeptidase [Ruminococcus sp.]|nr:D-alanyl-D-alanine carboxypeptidase [Ruminococcus sp.]
MKRNGLTFIGTMVCMMMTMLLASRGISAGAASSSAKSAIVIDALSGEVLYEQNAYERLPMASTTKIMSALIALESGNLDEQFIVDSEAIKVEGSSMGLQEGDTVSLRALVCGMLLPSGNDAANATAVRVAGSIDEFVKLMNDRAQQMGLSDTHFVTPSGLDDDTDEHYSTAYDMARLAAQALENEDFVAICSQKYIKLSYGNPPYDRWLTNTNKLLDNVDGIIGIKTGFTDKAKRCLVSACERDGARLICVTLNDPDDWYDHEQLYNECFEKMSDYTLAGNQYRISVAGGTKESIIAESESKTLKLPEDAKEHIEIVVTKKPFVFAPIKSGDKVGLVKCYYDGELIAQQDILACEDIDTKDIRLSTWQKALQRLDLLLEKVG